MVSTYFDNNQTLVRAILIYQFHCCFAVWFMFGCFSFSLVVLIVCTHSACFPSVVNFFPSLSLSLALSVLALSLSWPFEWPCTHSRTLLFKKSVNVCTLCNADYQCTFQLLFYQTVDNGWKCGAIIEILWHVHNSIHGISMCSACSLRCNSMQCDANVHVHSIALHLDGEDAWRLDICLIIFTLRTDGCSSRVFFVLLGIFIDDGLHFCGALFFSLFHFLFVFHSPLMSMLIWLR